jgi:amino acid adenylation domain-containing protein
MSQPAEPLLPDLVASWSRRSPGAVAVRQAGQDPLDYRGLDQISGRIAGWLRRHGAGPETLVAVRLDRTVDAPAVLLGVLRAGCAYLPIHASYADHRVAGMLADSGARYLVTGGTSPAAELAPTVQTVTVTELRCSEPDAAPAQFHPDQLAYVLYTSGSTGHPKGVGVSHRALVNCLTATAAMTGFAPGARLLSATEFAFDIATLELFLPLCSGGEVLLASADVAGDGDRLARLMAEWRPDYLHATPALWEMLLLAGWPGDPRLTAMIGGDVVGSRLAARLSACTARLWHLYGPTEATMFAVCRMLPPGPQRPVLPIGGPITGVTTRVVGQDFTLAVEGELCLGGTCVGRGYLRRPALTAARFVPDPRLPGRRLYRTGDVARVAEAGDLELHGRADRQIKIRGHRIEPGEIEYVLSGHPAVRAAAVVPAGDSLAAFVQPEQVPESPAAARDLLADVRGHAAARLPDVMRPGSYAALPALPLTPNGKVDRGLLSRLAPGRPYSPAAPAPPMPRAAVPPFRRLRDGDPALAILILVGPDDGPYEQWVTATEPERAVWRAVLQPGEQADAGLLARMPSSSVVLAGWSLDSVTAFRLAHAAWRLGQTRLPVLMVHPPAPQPCDTAAGPASGPVQVVEPENAAGIAAPWLPLARRHSTVRLALDPHGPPTAQTAPRLAALVAALG